MYTLYNKRFGISEFYDINRDIQLSGMPLRGIHCTGFPQLIIHA
jgi:hypothetical protein